MTPVQHWAQWREVSPAKRPAVTLQTCLGCLRIIFLSISMRKYSAGQQLAKSQLDKSLLSCFFTRLETNKISGGVWPLVRTLHSSGLTHQNANYENTAGRTLFSGSSQTPPCWFSPWGWSPRGRHWCEWPWWRGVPLCASVVWRELSGLTDTEAASWVVEGLALCRWCHTAGPERESSRAEQCRAVECRCLTLHRSPPAATTTTISLPS